MPDEPQSPQRLWKEQPEEKLAVNLHRIMNRRVESLLLKSRWDVILSLTAPLLLAGLMFWRLSPLTLNVFQQVGIAAIAIWLAVNLYRFRSRIFMAAEPRRDAVAATGWEYYRNALVQRREHLRADWLLQGPIFLTCFFFLATVLSNYARERPWSVAPFLMLLAVWVALRISLRLRELKEIDQEIAELNGQNGQP